MMKNVPLSGWYHTNNMSESNTLCEPPMDQDCYILKRWKLTCVVAELEPQVDADTVDNDVLLGKIPGEVTKGGL